MKKSLELLNTLIKVEEEQDLQWRNSQKGKNSIDYKGSESARLYHLKKLKELIIKEYGEIHGEPMVCP